MASRQKKNVRSTGPIYFYNKDEPYYEFTNFAHYHVTIDNKVWLTTEHYFQGQKFAGTPHEEIIRRMSYPSEAFAFAHTQHESLRLLLLSTEDRELVEHTKNDSYWGDGGDGSGKIVLGSF